MEYKKKTELCKNFPKCKYKHKCSFAHSINELRPIKLTPKMSKNFRRLPCRTWVEIGCCPYSDKCTFIHDPRIKSVEVFLKARSSIRSENSVDNIFIWPSVAGTSAIKNTPNVIEYNIRLSNNATFLEETVKDMWDTFCYTISNISEIDTINIPKRRLFVFYVRCQ